MPVDAGPGSACQVLSRQEQLAGRPSILFKSPPSIDRIQSWCWGWASKAVGQGYLLFKNGDLANQSGRLPIRYRRPGRVFAG